ncbi:GlsB/YeaQ/YmgE family stress response membrane protein [Sphingomonas sp. RS2018]
MAERMFLGWLAIGLVAGVLAGLAPRGRDSGGMLVTILIGIAGALLGGFVAQAIGQVTTDLASYGAAAAGAVLLLVLYRLMIARRS